MFIDFSKRPFKHQVCIVGALMGLWWGLMMMLWSGLAFGADAAPASLTGEQALMSLLRLGGAPAAMGYVGWQIAKAIGQWTPKVVVELPDSVNVIVLDEKGDRVMTPQEMVATVQSQRGD